MAMTMVIFFPMKIVSKSELKRRMLELFRDVERTGEPILVTDHRVPVLKVVPLEKGGTAEEIFGPFRDCHLDDEAVLSTTEDDWPLT